MNFAGCVWVSGVGGLDSPDFSRFANVVYADWYSWNISLSQNSVAFICYSVVIGKYFV